jgi:L-asparagine oxygenase
MTDLARNSSGLLEDLSRDGFSFRPGLSPHSTTIEVAEALGNIINVEDILPNSGISLVQSLKPKCVSDSRQSRYSGHYGLGVFPLHSDLAHWAVPPRYLLLRSLIGSCDVYTHVFPWAPIVKLFGAPALRKTVFGARKRRPGCSGLVRAMSYYDGSEVLRWDPIFLEPLNKLAKKLVLAMLDITRDSALQRVLLREAGDTLLIDNWRMLHGRDKVSAQSTARNIDRVYLAEVFR